MTRSVVLMLNAFWNRGHGMSGGDQTMIQIFKRLRPDLDRLVCYTNVDGAAAFGREIPGVEFRTSPAWYDRCGVMGSYLLRTLRAVLGRLDRADTVYGSSDFFPDVLPALLLKRLGRCGLWVQYVHHVYPHWRTRPGNKLMNFVAWLMQRLSFICIRWADMIMVVNTSVAGTLASLGLDPARIHLVPPGIDSRYIDSLEPALDVEPFQGVFLARLHPSKGIFDLVGIWQRVVARLPDARLAVIGGGSPENEAALKAAVDAGGLRDRVKILGYLENERMFSILKTGRAFLFPSHEEGFGMAATEAIACNLPVVSWDLPVFEEVFGAHTVRVREHDLDAFAGAVARLIPESEERRVLIQGARQFINKYSWESIAERQRVLLRISRQRPDMAP